VNFPHFLRHFEDQLIESGDFKLFFSFVEIVRQMNGLNGTIGKDDSQSHG